MTDNGIGTGAATAVLFAAQGAVTGVLDIDRERAEATCAIIAKDGGTAVPVIADITGTMLTSTAARPHLIQSGGGSIVNVSSVAGMRGFGPAPTAPARAPSWR